MTDKNRMLIWMALLVGAAAGISVLLFAPLAAAFQANPVFNGLILGVLAIGVLINFSQVIALGPATRWIDETDRGLPPTDPPRLVAPLARVVGSRDREREPVHLSTLTTRALLDGVRIRLDESRDISRYMVSLLIFLGLLGTFWGLLDTIGGVSGVIGGLATQSGDSARIFDTLATNLQGPLSGMGTAFSSSLFGLAGALALGVLDLQAGHAQSRFFSDLEEWLAARTQLTGARLGMESEGSLPQYLEALLGQTAENLSHIERLMEKNEDDRRAMHSGIAALNERLFELTDQMRAEQKLIATLAKDQLEMKPAIAELAAQVSGAVAGSEEMRNHLRSADAALARLVSEVAEARAEAPEALRQEVRLLTQSLVRVVRN